MKNFVTQTVKGRLLRLTFMFITTLVLVMSVNTGIAADYPGDYCMPECDGSKCFIDELHIYNKVNKIDYWNKSGYNSKDKGVKPFDYTNTKFKNAEWQPDNKVNFYIKAGGKNGKEAFYIRIYIDWNKDGDWEDTGEVVFNAGDKYKDTTTSSFDIPKDVKNGQYIMRFYIIYAGDLDNFKGPCTKDRNGEVEDYTLTVKKKSKKDAGITKFFTPENLFNSDNPQDVEVEIKNFGEVKLLEADIYWSVNGIQKPVYHWKGELEKGKTERVKIATTQTFTPKAPWKPFKFEAWTDGNSLVGEDKDANELPDRDSKNDKVAADISCIKNDAGFVNARAMLPLGYGENDIVLTITNYAPMPLASVTINYSIDGIAQTPYHAKFDTPLNRNETADVVCGKYFFGAGNRSYTIEAATSEPNGVPDEIPTNDAGRDEVFKALEGGVYTIGPRESDYPDIESAMRFVNYWGLAGPVTFLIREGSYYSSFVLAPPRNIQFPITFESITHRPIDVIVYNDDSKNDYIFQINGYNNVIFRNLTFEAPGIFFNFMGNVSNLTFDKCIFNAVAKKAKMLAPANDKEIFSINGNVTGLEISDCKFNGGKYAIYTPKQENATKQTNWNIHNNEFMNNSNMFIYFESNFASQCQFNDNVFDGSNAVGGIIMTNGSGNIIKKNSFTGFTGGNVIAVGNVGDANSTKSANEVIANTITCSNGFGITNFSGKNTIIKNNVISASADKYDSKHKYSCILDLNGKYSTIRDNNISINNMNGIHLLGTMGTKLAYNKLNGTAAENKENISGIYMERTFGTMIANNAVGTINSLVPVYGKLISNMEFVYNSLSANGKSPAFIIDQSPVVDEGDGGEEGDTEPLLQNDKKNQSDSQLFEVDKSVVLSRNIFQHNANGLAAVIIDNDKSIKSDHNNWWTAGEFTVDYNGTKVNFENYQAQSNQDEHSSNVEAKFMSASDLRLTAVNENLYYTRQMFGGTKFNNFEENDLSGTARTRTFYKGAYSMFPTIEIAQEPKDIVDCIGTTEHSFIVIANADYNAELSYQWYKDGEAIFDATGPILYINAPLDYEMGADYKCKIMGTGEAEDVWTRSALLYPLRPTEITRQPNNIRIDLGNVATFEIDMHIYKEAPSMYQPDIQWYRGTVALQENDRIAGVNSSMMTIRDVQPDDLGDNYYVIISGQCGSDQSDNITLSEIPALTVEDLPATSEVCKGSDASFTVKATSSVSGVTITYQWFKDGVALQDNARITGASAATLVISKVDNDDAGDYTCQVTLESFDQKTTNTTKLSIKHTPTIKTNLPSALSVKKDQKLTLTVVAEGDNLTYKWFKGGKEIAGATAATYEKEKAATADEGTYKVKISNDCGEVESSECVVSVTSYIMMGVDGEAGELILNQNVPNPFSTISRIAFVMPEAGQAKLAITNANGKELAVIVDGSVSAGLNQYNIDANALNLSSGVYYYTLTVNGNSVTKTMVIVK